MTRILNVHGSRPVVAGLVATMVSVGFVSAGQRGASGRPAVQRVNGDAARAHPMRHRPPPKPGFAILGPGRIMIGRNVLVEGVIGTRYGVDPEELDHPDGDPLVMRSDFRGLDGTLDRRLDVLYAEIVVSDVNGDNRLRVDHPIESANLAEHPELVDVDGNGDVDDFDLFLDHYDTNGDGGVTYHTERATSLVSEFHGIDDALARLIDEARPDRDGDGRITPADTALGYRDGVLDGRDAYGKVHGELAFAVTRAAWERAHGESWQTVVHGPVWPDEWDHAVRFGVGEEDLPEVTPELFDDLLAWFEDQVPPEAFREPGDPPLDPALLVDEAIAAGPDAEYVAPEDNDWESVPFGSDDALDFYQRPVYRDYTFRNVRIPVGNNALFVNCTFVGVTFIETESRCTHQDWNYAGAVEPVDDGMGNIIYVLRYPDLPPPPPDHICIDGVEVRDTRGYSNNIRFDSCTFLGSIAGDRLEEHAHWRNRVQLTGATRAFLHVDEVEPPTLTDAAGTLLIEYLAALSDEERRELARSTLLLPHWSVQTSGPEEDPPTILLRGLIVAGVLEARGALDVHGAVASTFRPVLGEGPLSYGGHPAQFVNIIGDVGGRGARRSGAITLRSDPRVMSSE